MKTTMFEGLYTALVTPFDKSGRVNETELKNLIDFQIESGVDGYFVGGSTGEAFLMTLEERKKLLEFISLYNGGKKKIIAHIGAISNELTIELGRHAVEAGADALSAVLPFYYGFSVDQYRAYYENIANALGVPVMVYYMPSAIGHTLSISDFEKLLSTKAIHGFKYTHTDYYTFERIRKAHPTITALNGCDECLLCGLVSDASGGVGASYNFMPKKIRKLYEAYKNNDLIKAQTIQHEINAVLECVFKHGTIASCKELLRYQGVEAGDCRGPFTPLDEAARNELKSVYMEHGC